LKKHSPAASKSIVSELKIGVLILVALAVQAFAEGPSGQDRSLPSQAKPVKGILAPVPKEIFDSLDKFRDANWREVQRPGVVRWKPHGSQVQTALLLGVVAAEGFIAMEAEDSAEVDKVGTDVLTLARALGVEKSALRRSRSIMEYADRNEWKAARKEWDGVLSDLEKGMIKLKSEQLSQLVSLAGWLRGTEALCTLVLQNYSPERAELVRQPALLDYLEKQLLEMKRKRESRSTVIRMLEGIRRIRLLMRNENRPLTEKTVRDIGSICRELVNISSERSS
jgi:hypothetical protein